VKYLLDTNVVSYFLQSAREMELAAAAAICPMVIVGEVRRELELDKHRGGPSFTKWLASSNIDSADILVGSPAASTLGQLTKGTATGRDLGERASIAMAAHDPSLTFVANDKSAMWIALRELWEPGDRIVGVAPFLRRGFDAGAIDDPGVLDDVIALVPHQRPTWWAAWRGSIATESGSTQ
jgi:hypothetical protein